MVRELASWCVTQEVQRVNRAKNTVSDSEHEKKVNDSQPFYILLVAQQRLLVS